MLCFCLVRTQHLRGWGLWATSRLPQCCGPTSEINLLTDPTLTNKGLPPKGSGEGCLADHLALQLQGRWVPMPTDGVTAGPMRSYAVLLPGAAEGPQFAGVKEERLEGGVCQWDPQSCFHFLQAQTCDLKGPRDILSLCVCIYAPVCCVHTRIK